MSNELAKNGTTELATEAPADLFDGATGFEGVTHDCLRIPFLKLAQTGTPEAKELNAAYIPGLKPGMFFCSATRKIYGDSINLVVVNFNRTFVMYEGEGNESEFKGTITPAEFSRDIEPHGVREKSYVICGGIRYVDSRNFLVIPYDSPFDGTMMLSLTSTGIKPSQLLLTQATNVHAVKDGKPVTAPIWSSVWNLKTQYIQDKKGDYNQISGVTRVGWVAKDLASGFKQAFEDMQGANVSAVEEKEDTPAPEQRRPSAAEMAAKAGGENEETIF